MIEFKKPEFWNSFSQIGGFLFTIVSNCIAVMNFPEKWNFWQKSGCIVGISFGSYFIFMILYNVRYTIQLKKYCNKIEEKNEELSCKNNGLLNDNQKIETDYNNLYKDFEYSLLLGDIIVGELRTGMASKKKDETEFLKQLFDIIYTEQEIRKEMKGDKKYERR